jgi:hypothetical protein
VGKARAPSCDLGAPYKTAFVLAHKLREAVASEMKGAHVGGDHRRLSNGEQFRSIVALVAKNKPSVDFRGYWRRARTHG